MPRSKKRKTPTKKQKIAKPLTEEQRSANRKRAADQYDRKVRQKISRIKYHERMEEIGPEGPRRDQQRKVWRDEKREQRAKQRSKGKVESGVGPGTTAGLKVEKILVFSGSQRRHQDVGTPILPPDIARSVGASQRVYNERIRAETWKHNKYVNGALYNNFFSDKYVIIDPWDVDGADQIKIEIKIGYQKTTTIDIKLAEKGYVEALLAFDNQAVWYEGGKLGNTQRKKQAARGKMDVMGWNGRNGKAYVGYDAFEGIASKLTNATNQYLMKDFKKHSERIKRFTRNVPRAPGMEKAFFSEWTRSYDLVNAAHVDAGDACVGIATWIEKVPGRAKDWFFILPNLVLDGAGERGTLIRLRHGLTIAWDGRLLHHCSSVGELGDDNHVMGYYFGANSKKI